MIIDHDWLIGHESEFDCHLLRDNAEPIELPIERLKTGIRVEFQLLPRDFGHSNHRRIQNRAFRESS